METEISYTVAAVAERLKPGSDAREQHRVLRWLQNSTTSGLLRPIGGKHGGRGVHRRYSDDEVRKAAVLLMLSEIDLPGRQLESVAEWFDDVLSVHGDTVPGGGRGRQWHGPKAMKKLRDSRRLWDAARSGRVVHLSMTVLRDGTFDLRLTKASPSEFGTKMTIVINLARVFGDLG
mgnify:CR=1 FL=1